MIGKRSAVWGLAVAAVFAWAMPAQAMNKAELVEAMASEAGLSKADAKKALDGFINATSSALKKGDRVSLTNFGAFAVIDRLADPSAETSSGEVDFVAGRAFNDSDYAPAYSFKLEVEGAEDGIIDYLDPDDDGDGIPTVWVSGGGFGAVKKGDDVALMAGDELLQEAKVMGAVVHRSQAHGHGGSGGRIAVYTAASGDDHTLWCWGDNSSGRQGGNANNGNGNSGNAAPGRGNGGGAGGSILVCAADGDVQGVLLSGVRAGQLRPGMTVVKRDDNGSNEDNGRPGSDAYERASGEIGGGIVRDWDLIQRIMDETRLGERSVIAAYNALLNIIVDEVNAGRFVDLAGFGRFGTEAVATVQVIDPCAGDPEACLQGIDDPALLREILANDYVEHEVSVAISEGDLDEAVEAAGKISKRSARTGRNPQTGKEIKIPAGAGGGGSVDEATPGISKRSARTGRNPQTGKEIKIAAKNKVKFKAGADLSKSVN